MHTEPRADFTVIDFHGNAVMAYENAQMAFYLGAVQSAAASLATAAACAYAEGTEEAIEAADGLFSEGDAIQQMAEAGANLALIELADDVVEAVGTHIANKVYTKLGDCL